MKIQTKCDGCVFASRDGVTQVGCELDALNKLAKHGGRISLDMETSSFVVEDRYCQYKRYNNWPAYNQPNWDVVLRSEVLHNFKVFIFTSDIRDSEDEIVRLCTDLSSQCLRPKFVDIIHNSNRQIKFSNLKKRLDTLNLNYQVHIPVKPTEKVDLRLWSLERKEDYDFLLDIAPWAKLPEDFFANIDEAINDYFMRFTIIKGDPELGYGDIYPKELYDFFDGDKPKYSTAIYDEPHDKVLLKNFREKVDFLAEKQNKAHMVVSYGDILNVRNL